MSQNHKLQWASFMQDNAVSSIIISANSSINQRNISDVTLNCISEQHGDYRVSFKLGDQCADICCYLTRVSNELDFAIELTEKGLASNESELKILFANFLRLIKPRLKEAQKEQEIQSIKFVDNTFILNNVTTFTVISDDGEGRLSIDIQGSGSHQRTESHQRNKSHQQLKLSAHGLLDGLYMGTIKLVKNS